MSNTMIIGPGDGCHICYRSYTRCMCSPIKELVLPLLCIACKQPQKWCTCETFAEICHNGLAALDADESMKDLIE